MRTRKPIDTTLGELIVAVSDAVSPLTHNRTKCGLKKIPYSSSPEVIELNSRLRTPMLGNENGKVGWILLWAIGVPVPVLILLFLVRGCT